MMKAKKEKRGNGEAPLSITEEAKKGKKKDMKKVVAKNSSVTTVISEKRRKRKGRKGRNPLTAVMNKPFLITLLRLARTVLRDTTEECHSLPSR